MDSKTARLNEPVSSTLTADVSVGDMVVVPSGSVVSGVVSAVEPAGKVKGRASMSLAFRSLIVEGHDAPYTVVARRSFQAASTKKEDAAKIGVPAAGVCRPAPCCRWNWLSRSRCGCRSGSSRPPSSVSAVVTTDSASGNISKIEGDGQFGGRTLSNPGLPSRT